jgi:predicted ester cyclase
MDPETVVRKCFEAFEAGRTDEAASYLDDSFTFTGAVPEPVAKKDFVNLQGTLIKAMPDWKFNYDNLRVDGETVHTNVHITGTNTQPLPAIMPGMPGIPVTGKHVSLPEEPVRLIVHNGKITRMSVEPTPGGGVEGVLKQLGAQRPG